MLEVGDGPDGRGPAVNERGGRKGRVGPARGWWAGRRDGPAACSGLCGRKKKKEDGPSWAGMREGREGWVVFFSFFFNHSSTFQTFKIKLLFKLFKIQIIFQNFQINLKAFKASHQQTKKPHAFKS
jgi:hypothetical protein